MTTTTQALSHISQNQIIQGIPTQEETVSLPPVPPSTRESYEDGSLYLLTTECGQKENLEKLLETPPKANGVLLGFAYEYNYNILAVRPMARAIICDINRQMHEFYKWTANNIPKHETPKEFLEAFQSKIDENPTGYLHLAQNSKEVMKHYTKDFMWTSNFTSYEIVRNMYIKGKISHVNLNLSEDTVYFNQLRLWAEKNGYVFDVIYLSNIPEWIHNNGMQAVERMRNNLMEILSPQTLLIDAKQEESGKGEPKLRLTTHITNKKGLPSFTPNATKKRKTNHIPSSLPSDQLVTSSASLEENVESKALKSDDSESNQTSTKPDDKQTVTTHQTQPKDDNL
jgi:hypothetical protein